MDDSPRFRRSLSHVGGAIHTEGDRDAAGPLAHALDVAAATDADDDPARAHVHGFHTYPARMHPATAARLVGAFVRPGGRVLDPFCGSGTVVVEAVALGRRAVGVDLNPLAVRLARCKARPRGQEEADGLVDRARECAEFADTRRLAKAGATRRFPPEDVALFEPHVLLELDSLRAKIEAVRDEPARLDLSLVLSSLLIKFSKQRGDTSATTAPRRTAAGSTTKMFVRKTEELVRRFAEFAALLPTPPPPPPAVVAQDDATELRTVAGPVDAIVTSPPYAATYDYVSHHALRLRWLGLDPAPLVGGELGSRAAYQRVPPGEAAKVWAAELARFFQAAGRVLPAGAPLVLLMADSAVGGVALRADEVVAQTARDCGFYPAARASQARPHFHGPGVAAFRDRPRAEHAILLVRR